MEPYAQPLRLPGAPPSQARGGLLLVFAGALVVAFWGGLWVGAGWVDVNTLEKGPRIGHQALLEEAAWRLTAGVLAGSGVIALPLCALGGLVWLQRRRRVPELVLARVGGRCAYCHDDAFGVAAPCVRCGSLLHATCWLEAERCPTLGCRGGPNARFARAPQAATIELGGARHPAPAAARWPRSS